MAQDSAEQILKYENLTELENSEGAKHLIMYPRNIVDYKSVIETLETDRAKEIKEIENLQIELDDLKKIKWWKKIFQYSKYDEKREEILKKMGDLSADIAHLDMLIGDFKGNIKELEEKIDIFLKKLIALGITPDEVIAEYNRVKAELSSGKVPKKARFDMTESELKIEDAIPDQNRKTYPKLSRTEKFRRRWGDSAEAVKKLSQQTSTQKQPE